MGGSHRGGAVALHQAGSSPVHRLGAPAKLIGLVVFVVAVALTPARAVGALALDAVALAVVVAVARLRPRMVAARLAAVVPFLLFAVALPVIGTGERVDVIGLSLSVDGLWSAWAIAARALLGATAAIVVTATTPLPDLLSGMARLRVPALVVSIVAFALRYLDVVADDLRRMRRAMTARGHDPRWLWQVGPIASSVGALFVRSYERGERIHLAMRARGFDGRVHAATAGGSVLRGQWVSLVPAACAAGGAIVAGAVR
jgi:cobalt/nickel transport system permease protein